MQDVLNSVFQPQPELRISSTSRSWRPGGEHGNEAGEACEWYFFKILFQHESVCPAEILWWRWKGHLKKIWPSWQIYFFTPIRTPLIPRPKPAHVWIPHGPADRDRENPKPDLECLRQEHQSLSNNLLSSDKPLVIISIKMWNFLYQASYGSQATAVPARAESK